jgi:thiamine biosynthesis lipoprotein
MSLTRRRCLHAALVGLPAMVLAADAPPPVLHRRPGIAFGTTVAVTVADPDPALAERALDAAYAEIRLVERLTGLFREGGTLARLNRDGRLTDPPPELLDLLRLAQALHAASGGAFDVTVQPLWRCYADALATGRLPTGAALAKARARVDAAGLELGRDSVRLLGPGMAVTLNGIAQGYATDRVLARLRALGIRHAFVDTGELGLIGRRGNGEPWTIALPGQGLLRLAGGCLATSSDAELAFTPDRRLHHILDPRTGVSPTELAAATVLAPTGALADGLSTALMLTGAEAGLAMLGHFPGTEALLVAKTGEVRATPGFPLGPHSAGAAASPGATPAARRSGSAA